MSTAVSASPEASLDSSTTNPAPKPVIVEPPLPVTVRRPRGLLRLAIAVIAITPIAPTSFRSAFI